MKRYVQISIVLTVILTIFLVTGFEFGGVGVVHAADSVEFAVVTDYGTGYADETTVASMINGWSPDFIVTTGDNYQLISNADVYPTYVGNYYGPGAATDWITPGNFYPAIGNHDYYAGGNESDRFYNYFNPFGYIDFVEDYESPYDPADDTLYYEFVRGPVHFFMIDTGNQDNTTPDSTDQHNWLADALDASTSTWNIVVFHMPAASGGASHGSDTGIQWDFAGMGADFVISGHNHVYERISWNGIRYFTAGTGGGNARQNFDASNLPNGAIAEDYYGVLGDTLSGAMLVNASDMSITFQYITKDGTVQDTYTQLSTPSNLTAVAVSTSQIYLSWTDNTNDESAYRVERSPNGSTDWSQIADLAVNTTSYSDTGLSPDETWYYRVRAYRSSGTLYSAYSNIESATTNNEDNENHIFLPLIEH